MNHLEVYQIERYVPSSESHWLEWANRVEALLYHSLDGDQDTDGYSLDSAYNAFLSGATEENYVEFVKHVKYGISEKNG